MSVPFVSSRRTALRRTAAGLVAVAVAVTGCLAAAPAVADPTPARSITGGGSLHPVGAVFAADGKSAYVADQGGFVNVVDTSSDNVGPNDTIDITGPPPAPNCSLSGAALTPDGASLYAPGWNCTGGSYLLKFDTLKNTYSQSIQLVNAGTTGAVAVSPDGLLALVWVMSSATNAPALYRVTLATRTVLPIPIGTVSANQSATAVVISADSSTAYVTGDSGSVAKVNIAAGTATQIPITGAADGLSLSPDGATVYVASTDGTVQKIATANDAVSTLTTIPDAHLATVGVTPDGTKLVVAGSAATTGSTAWVLTASSGLTQNSFAIGNSPWTVAVSPDGTKAYIPAWGASQTNVVQLSDAAPMFTKDPATPTATVGKTYSAQFAASGYPYPTFGTVGDLPAGITMDATTGLLSGTPTALGAFTFSATASNGLSPDAISSAHTITVKGVLTVHTPKVSGTKKVGKTLKAKTVAWAPKTVKLSYQWQRLTKGKWVSISKATKSSHKLVKADKGHKVRVTVTGTKTNYVTASKSSTSYAIK